MCSRVVPCVMQRSSRRPTSTGSRWCSQGAVTSVTDALARSYEAEAVAQALCMETEDFSRAFRAFAAKQKPVFALDHLKAGALLGLSQDQIFDRLSALFPKHGAWERALEPTVHPD